MTVKNKSFWWHLGNSLWVLLGLVPFIYWLPFFLIGKWVNNRSYRIMGYVHLGVAICLGVGVVSPLEYWCLFGSMLHILVVFIWCLMERKNYLHQLAQKNAKARVVEKLVTQDVPVTPEPETTPETAVQKLNVNSCTEEQLCALPGIGIIEAKKMITLRQTHGDFSTVEEFIAAAQIKPHIAVRIVDGLYAEPTAKAVEQKTASRILDF